MLASALIPGFTGASLEWVREDSIPIRSNGGVFPSPPGVYYCRIDCNSNLYVDPLLSVKAEAVTMVDQVTGVIQHIPYQGSLRVYEMPSSQLLKLGVDYTINENQINFMVPVPSQVITMVDYTYPGVPYGPFKVQSHYGYNKIIPGAVLAFGDGLPGGKTPGEDGFAVVVSNKRDVSYEEYGGKWEMSVEIEVTARDVYAQPRISDRTMMYIWAKLRPRLADQGIDITNVSLSGETEEVYDETADDYYYSSTITLSVNTDWAMHIPTVTKLSFFETTISGLPNSLVGSLLTDPFYSARFTFEEPK